MAATEVTRSLRKAHVIYKAADGERLPGTTTVLGLRGKDLTEWAFRLGQNNQALHSVRDYVDDLARIGSLVHHYAESIIAGVEPDTDDYTRLEIKAAEPAVEKFRQWYSQNNVKVIFSERAMVSEAYRFGGTIDIFADYNGKRALIDIKTGKGIYREYFYQTAAYAELLKENGERVDEIRILRVGRVGSEGFEERSVSDWSLYWDAFLALRTLYGKEKEIERFEKLSGG